MRIVCAAILTTTGLLLGGCFSDGDDSNVGPTDTSSGNGAPVTPPPALGFKARFQPLVGILPYPNDLYFNGSTDGTLNLPANAFAPGTAAINALDGFSTTASITARFDGAIDPATLTAENIRVIRLNLDNATKAPLIPPAPGGALPAPLTFGTDFTATVAAEAGSGGGTLLIRPTRPLRPSTGATNIGYLVLLTNGIQNTAGDPAVPDADYATIKEQAIEEILAGSSTPTCAPITNATLNAICRLTFAHLSVGAAVGVDPQDVVLSFGFSTQSTQDTLAAVSATATAQPIGAQFTGLNTSQVNPNLPGTADIWSGTLQVPYFLSKTAPLTASWQAAGASPAPGIDPASRHLTRFNPLPGATETLTIPLLVTKPNATASSMGVRPPNGWPVVIFQHGITGDRSQMLAIADAFANAPGGFVVVAIDQPLHGLPASSPLYQEPNERHFNLDLVNNMTGAAGPDDVIDPSGTHFINLTSLLTSRDNLRQAAADLMTLARSVVNLELTGDAMPDIDGTRIHFVGHSLGGIVGTPFLAFNPGISTATLAMPGGHIAQLLQDSASFAPRINAGLQAQGLLPGTTLYNQFFRDAQTAIDSADPWNHGAAAAAAAPIHMIQVIGDPPASNPDQVVPNSATERLANVMGLTRVSTPGPNPVTHGFVNFIAGDHGSILSPAASLPATVEMQTQTVTFAVTSGTVIAIANPAVVEP